MGLMPFEKCNAKAAQTQTSSFAQDYVTRSSQGKARILNALEMSLNF